MVGRKSDTRAIALRTVGDGANSAARCRTERVNDFAAPGGVNLVCG
jgi:hypothetical protein